MQTEVHPDLHERRIEKTEVNPDLHEERIGRLKLILICMKEEEEFKRY